jgi:DNA repair exonuclease SbcCD ATPase subunit
MGGIMLHGTPGYITVEIVMFFGLGFLLAALLMLAFMPAVHRRAERLTRRKYAPVPLEQKEMNAEKDRLRADFAMSTRKLELEIDKMQEKAAVHLTDIAKKSETIAALKQTLDARDILIGELQNQFAQEAQAVRGGARDVQALRAEIANKNSALHAANQRIVALMTEVNGLNAALSERARIYDTQRHEITALNRQSDVLRREIEALSRPAPRQPAATQPAPVFRQPAAPQAPQPTPREPAPMPSPAFAQAPQALEIRLRETNEDSDVIRRALEAIEASGIHVHSEEWTNSRGAIPFGH